MGRTSTYPIEFRQQAAALVLDGERTLRDVARELGVNHETLRNQVARERKNRAAGPSALSTDERLESPARGRCPQARLRRKVAELELEKEILKKAVVFFAKETGR
ncbi:transposase [Kineococcus sp. SYSU DK005]|uniref:transposase n=1 Tax=Kineococcus sp. SYSU DK005 TaxID=3383126 RepID=UPI003D7CB049